MDDANTRLDGLNGLETMDSIFFSNSLGEGMHGYTILRSILREHKQLRSIHCDDNNLSTMGGTFLSDFIAILILH